MSKESRDEHSMLIYLSKCPEGWIEDTDACMPTCLPVYRVRILLEKYSPNFIKIYEYGDGSIKFCKTDGATEYFILYEKEFLHDNFNAPLNRGSKKNIDWSNRDSQLNFIYKIAAAIILAGSIIYGLYAKGYSIEDALYILINR